MPVTYLKVIPYQDDEMNLPVRDVDTAAPYYESLFGFKVLARSDQPCRSVTLGRDDIRIGLAENGGKPEEEGCFFQVNDVETAFAELKARGLDRDEADYRVDPMPDGASYRLFFVVAPDGLCYCIGERVPS